MTTESKRPAEFWTAFEDAEEFYCQSQRQAVLEWLDYKRGAINAGDEERPTEITLYGHAPLKIGEVTRACEARTLAEELVERLDEDFGKPDEGTTVIGAMEEAARLFVDAVVDVYRVWACEKVAEVTLPITWNGEEWTGPFQDEAPVPTTGSAS